MTASRSGTTKTGNRKSLAPRGSVRVQADPVLGPLMMPRMADMTDMELSGLMRDALGYHFRLLDRALRSLNFSAGEVQALLDVVRDWEATPTTTPYFWVEVREKAGEALGEKVRALDDLSAVALVTTLKAALHTAGRYGGELDAARELGLLPDKADVGRNL